MAEFNYLTNLAPQIQPMNIGGMLDLARGVQAYQQSLETNPLQVEKLQEEVKHARAQATKAQETLQSEITTSKAQSEKALTEAQKSSLGLSQDKYVAAAKIAGASATDPRLVNLINKKDTNGIVEYLDDLRPELERAGLTKSDAASSLAVLINQANKNPDLLIPALTTLSKRALAPSEAVGLVTPKTTTNAAGQIVAVNPVTGQLDVMGTPNVNPMSARSRTEVDPVSGDTIAYDIGPQGTPINVRFLKSAAQPGANMPMAVPAGESTETGKVYQGQIIKAREAGGPAKVAINNIDTILKYLPLAQAGKGSEAISGLQSVFGNLAGSTAEEKAAAARDIIQKNIASLALSANESIGGKYVESLKLAEQSIADAGRNPTAIIKSMEQLRPLMQHAYNYQEGLNKTVQNSPEKQFAKPKFDSEMNKAFDVEALMMKNAFDRGGQKGLIKFLDENKITKDKQASLFQKLERYQKLVNEGL
jgi:hypothetical protein